MRPPQGGYIMHTCFVYLFAMHYTILWNIYSVFITDINKSQINEEIPYELSIENLLLRMQVKKLKTNNLFDAVTYFVAYCFWPTLFVRLLMTVFQRKMFYGATMYTFSQFAHSVSHRKHSRVLPKKVK